MSSLSIRKKSVNTWLHNDSIFGDFIISKFYFNSFDNEFRIVEEGNSRLVAYAIGNITLYDDTDGGAPETFSTITELSLRLEELQYPAFDRTGTTVFPSMEQITNVDVTDIEDGQVLAWDATTNKWVNITIGSITSPVTSVNYEIGDVVVDGSNIDALDPTDSTEKTLNEVLGNIYSSTPSTPTLQEVTDVGNETTNEVIVRQNANNYVAIGNDGYTRWFTDVFGAYAEGKLGVIIGQNEVGTVIYEDDGLGNLIPSTSTYLDGLEVVSQDILNNKSVALKPNGFRKIESGNNYFSILPNQNNLLINGSVVVSSNVTAVSGVTFNIVATATLTDPTPVEGMGYYVNVINGIATVGGVAYSVGTKLFRHYHSGSWRTFVYPSTLQLENFLRDETLLKGYVCLTPNGINAPNSFRDITYSSSGTTGYITQNNYAKTGAVGMVGFQSTAVAGTVAFKRRNDSYNFSNTNAIIWQKIEFDSNVSGARFHHLLSNNFQFTAPTNVNQTSLLNCVGFCKLATSDNLHILHNDSSGTATTIDLGSSFPANNSGGNKRYLLGIQIKATSYVLTVIEINTTTNALTTNIYTTEVSTDIPARSLSALQISTMITNNATASNATYLDGGLVATNLF